MTEAGQLENRIRSALQQSSITNWDTSAKQPPIQIRWLFWLKKYPAGEGWAGVLPEYVN
jgi:hypothetical protein